MGRGLRNRVRARNGLLTLLVSTSVLSLSHAQLLCSLDEVKSNALSHTHEVHDHAQSHSEDDGTFVGDVERSAQHSDHQHAASQSSGGSEDDSGDESCCEDLQPIQFLNSVASVKVFHPALLPVLLYWCQRGWDLEQQFTARNYLPPVRYGPLAVALVPVHITTTILRV